MCEMISYNEVNNAEKLKVQSQNLPSGQIAISSCCHPFLFGMASVLLKARDEPSQES